jgi:3-phenylpropionate/trans-cinnamate dioxygenase ferredoxin subunit
VPSAVLVGGIDDFPVGIFRIVDVQGREVGVYRATDGLWFAARNLCPHRGGPLCRGRVGATMLPSDPGEFVVGLDQEVVRCPWHAMEFSLVTGESLFTDSALRIGLHDVAVRDGEVWVDPRPRASERSQ